MNYREDLINKLAEITAYFKSSSDAMGGTSACELFYGYAAAAAHAAIILKEQEPRLLTLEEVKALKLPADVYVERSYSQKWLYAATITGVGSKGCSSFHDSLDFKLYNREAFGWRIWSSRPTDEHRMAVKWDDEG